jgi:hypothetical protein
MTTHQVRLPLDLIASCLDTVDVDVDHHTLFQCSLCSHDISRVSAALLYRKVIIRPPYGSYRNPWGFYDTVCRIRQGS